MTDAELQALLNEASPGPWHHVNPGMVSPKTRTIHGTVPAEPVDYVSTWLGLGTPSGHRVVINRNVGVRSADMALIAEAPALAKEVLALRATAAASAERIKALEARVAELEAEFDEGPICQTSVSKSEEPQTSDRAALEALILVVERDGHDGSHLEDDDGQNECPVCATVATIRAQLKETDQ